MDCENFVGSRRHGHDADAERDPEICDLGKATALLDAAHAMRPAV
jgi:hypothetical protein